MVFLRESLQHKTTRYVMIYIVIALHSVSMVNIKEGEIDVMYVIASFICKRNKKA